ncbi:MAG: DUF3558 family protein [Microbacterium sp.]|nr:DUF3558 family protein [Microbacterium sp.]
MTAPRWRAFVAVAATISTLTLLLAACAPETRGESAPSPSHEPPSSSAPTASPSEPRAAFDGDCEQVLSAEALSNALGRQLKVWSATWDDGADRGLGGVSCNWASGDYPSVFARVEVYPTEVLDVSFVTGAAANGCEADASSCVVSDVFGDVWVGVHVQANGAAGHVDALRPVLADIGARVSTQPDPTPELRADWWGPVPTCADLQTKLAAGGTTATVVEERPATFDMYLDGPLRRTCTLTTTIDGAAYTALVHLRAGAASAVESALATSAEARVEYNGRVFASAGEQYPIDGAVLVLLGAVGPNLVELDRRDFEAGTNRDPKALDAVVAALG